MSLYDIITGARRQDQSATITGKKMVISIDVFKLRAILIGC